MNFFERQRQVRRISSRLVLLFLLAVVGIVTMVDLAVLLLFVGGLGETPSDAAVVLAATSTVVVALIGTASLFRTLALRGGGGGRVARSLGATPVPTDTTDPHLRRLRNVVEEVAIASGVPVPELYVLEDEPGINAFAAGWSPSDAAVAVTRGALERLNRDELQGVIAHEFSHIVNGDMRLNIRLMGLLFGILVLSYVGRILLRVRSRERNPLPLLGLALLVIGSVGVFVGRIIKAAVSRQREYLADASAVQFTRQTAGLTGALKKIAGLSDGSELRNAKAEDVSHMLFGSGGFSGLFATHPPLLRRIQVLDPSVKREELEALRRQWAATPPSGLAEDRAMGLGGHTSGSGLPAADTRLPARPREVAATVGDLDESVYRRAGAILRHIPKPFRERARRPDTVLPLIFGLLLSGHPEVRHHQHAVIAAHHGAQVADAAWAEREALASLHPMLRLPLAEVAFPVLRGRPERDAIMTTVHALIRADGRLSVHEYCLSRLLQEELYEATHRAPSWGRRRRSLRSSRSAALTLLAVLAQEGHPDPQSAARAFAMGAQRLFPDQPAVYAPPPYGVAALENVWASLDGLGPTDKQALVESLVAVISHDGEMTVAEAELLRTICSMLHCPMPPLAETVPV